MKYIIMGDPIAWKRPGVNNQKRFYDRQTNEKMLFGLELRRQHGDNPVFEGGPLRMDIYFYMPIPKHLIKKISALRQQHSHIYTKTKPDTSNLLKLIEDAARFIIYKDDVLIASHFTHRVYDDGNGPRMEFEFFPLPNLV